MKKQSINENLTAPILVDQIENEKSFILNLEKEEFKIRIGLLKNDSKIKIIAESPQFLVNYHYEEIFNLESLKKLNKFFIFYETIDQVDKMINELLNSKNAFLKKDANSQVIIIVLQVQVPGMPSKEIDLTLKKVMMNENNFNEKISEKISSLEERILKLELENKELKEIKDKLQVLLKWKNDVEEEEKLKSEKIDSLIINDKKEIKFIEDKLLTIDDFKNKKKIIYTLIYRASRDGDSPKVFHALCDNSPNNISFFKTKKGVRFGGFTTQTWKHINNNSDYTRKVDLKSFCFSINYKKIYPALNSNSTIYCSNDHGPWYGTKFFGVKNNFLSEEGGCSKTRNNYYGNQDQDFEINNFEEKFICQEIEIFQLNFEWNSYLKSKIKIRITKIKKIIKKNIITSFY